MSRPVVVTGLGCVSAHGCGREAVAAALARGVPASSEVERSTGHRRAGGARTAALVRAEEVASWLPAGAARRMSPPSRYAVAAARMALQDAGLEAGRTEGPLMAVAMATAFGPSSSTEGLLREIWETGPESASPFRFTECVANAPAAHMAIATAARGANLTLTEGEAGPLLAVARGRAEVSSGRAVRALAGAVDEANPLLHSILDRFGALARARGDVEEMPRPFDRRRSGALLAEGAAVLVLEPEAEARGRGARILARIAGDAGAFDPTARAAGWGSGAGPLGAALRRFLERAGGAATIDRIVSGASGSPGGDRLEAAVLREAFGGRPLPPVHVPKGILGEHAGGLLAAGILAMQGAPIARPAGCGDPDPALGVAPYQGAPLPAPARMLLTSLAAGGAAAWLLLERP